METRKFTVTAEGTGRLEVLNRISVLYIQRHIPVERMSLVPAKDGNSRYEICALTNEETIRRVVDRMNHIVELRDVRYAAQ